MGRSLLTTQAVVSQTSRYSQVTMTLKWAGFGYAKVKSQHPAGIDLAFHRLGQFLQLGADRVIERLAVLGQFHCLVLALEQLFAGEVLERLDAPR